MNNNIASAQINNYDKIYLDFNYSDSDPLNAAFIVSSITGDLFFYKDFSIYNRIEQNEAYKAAARFYNSFVSEADAIPLI